MGPRRYRRGNDESPYHFGSDHEASMGPRRYRRGNSDSTTFPVTVLSLQWGHDVTVAEIGEVSERLRE